MDVNGTKTVTVTFQGNVVFNTSMLFETTMKRPRDDDHDANEEAPKSPRIDHEFIHEPNHEVNHEPNHDSIDESIHDSDDEECDFDDDSDLEECDEESDDNECDDESDRDSDDEEVLCDNCLESPDYVVSFHHYTAPCCGLTLCRDCAIESNDAKACIMCESHAFGGKVVLMHNEVDVMSYDEAREIRQKLLDAGSTPARRNETVEPEPTLLLPTLPQMATDEIDLSPIGGNECMHCDSRETFCVRPDVYVCNDCYDTQIETIDLSEDSDVESVVY